MNNNVFIKLHQPSSTASSITTATPEEEYKRVYYVKVNVVEVIVDSLVFFFNCIFCCSCCGQSWVKKEGYIPIQKASLVKGMDNVLCTITYVHQFLKEKQKKSLQMVNKSKKTIFKLEMMNKSNHPKYFGNLLSITKTTLSETNVEDRD